MEEAIKAIFESPIPKILILAGIAFLLLFVIGNLGKKIVVDPQKRKYAGILGAVLLIIGLGLYTIPDNDQPNGRNCEQLNIKIRDREKDLHISMRDRDRAVAEMNRIQPLLTTDPHAQGAYQHQEDRLREVEEFIKDLSRQIDELKKERDKVCA